MTTKHFLTVLCLSLFLAACGGNSDSGILSAVHAASPQNIHKAFLNQVGPIPETVMATPTTDGDYRMVVYLTAGACVGDGRLWPSCPCVMLAFTAIASVCVRWTDWGSNALAGGCLALS